MNIEPLRVQNLVVIIILAGSLNALLPGTQNEYCSHIEIVLERRYWLKVGNSASLDVAAIYVKNYIEKCG